MGNKRLTNLSLALPDASVTDGSAWSMNMRKLIAGIEALCRREDGRGGGLRGLGSRRGRRTMA